MIVRLAQNTSGRESATWPPQSSATSQPPLPHGIGAPPGTEMLSLAANETEPEQLAALPEPVVNTSNGIGAVMQTRGNPDATDGISQIVPPAVHWMPNQLTVTVWLLLRPVHGPTTKPPWNTLVSSNWSWGRQVEPAGPHEPSHWIAPPGQ
jgi:hypothetical protein